MALMSPQIETPHELFVHKLGAALTMEETILELLEKLQEEASDSKLRRDLKQHHKETQQQVQNLQQCFQALGEPIEDQPCPTVEGLEKEGKTMIKQVDASLVDSVILSGVIETEHHEIAVYDGLIIKAEQMGDDDIVALLNENLEQEEGALDKAVKASEQSAKQLVQQYS
jgi:ferritin-like metal-binding protein YciE